MTINYGLIYLLAFDCMVFIFAFFLTGDLLFFWFGLVLLVFYYYALSWQLETKWIEEHTMTEEELIEALEREFPIYVKVGIK